MIIAGNEHLFSLPKFKVTTLDFSFRIYEPHLKVFLRILEALFIYFALVLYLELSFSALANEIVFPIQTTFIVAAANSLY
jgi:hypothetical protein